jgi:hypothetical protein
MRFLRPLLGLTRLNHQRNSDIRNRLKVKNSRRYKTISKQMVRPPGMNGQKPPTDAGFPIPTSGTPGYGKTKMKRRTP